MTTPKNPFELPSFANPWSLRVFAVTLAAAEAGLFSLDDFQQALIARIGNLEAQGACVDSDESYYTCWAEALTALLSSRQFIGAATISPAEHAVRDAVKAVRHAHTHAHGQDEVDHHGHSHARPQPRPLYVEAAQ